MQEPLEANHVPEHHDIPDFHHNLPDIKEEDGSSDVCIISRIRCVYEYCYEAPRRVRIFIHLYIYMIVWNFEGDYNIILSILILYTFAQSS